MALRILGVDPGSRVTGYGVIEVEGPRSRWLAHGQIRCGEGELGGRLLQIFSELGALIREYRPQEAAVESVFVNRNVSSAIVLGQARGAAICALAGAGLSLAEYAPAQVKSAIVGQGRAEKAQVQHMIKALLQLERAPPADASDALAVALLEARGFTQEDFALSHPGGSLGRRLLLKIADLMHTGERIPRVAPEATLSQALLEMTRKGLGMTAVVDADDHLLGVFTDGDLRRVIDNGLDVRQVKIAEVMTRGGKGIEGHQLAVEAVNLMDRHKITVLPVLDAQRRLAGVVHMHDLLRAGVV